MRPAVLATRLSCACAAACVIAVNASAARGPESQVPDAGITPRQLAANVEIRASLSGDEVHVYSVSAAAGEYIRVQIDQSGEDLVARITPPAGGAFAEIDGRWNGVEQISAIASETGSHQISVRRVSRGADRAEYRIVADPPRLPGAADESAIAGEGFASRAKGQIALGTGAALREALVLLDEALRAWTSAEDAAGQAFTLNTRGFVKQLLGDNRAALIDFEASLQRRQQLGDLRGEVETLGNIASAYSQLGDKPEAARLYQHALQRAESGGLSTRAVATILSNLARVHYAMGDFDTTLSVQERALAVWRALGDRLGEALALNVEGGLYMTAGDRQLALERLTESVELWRTIKDPRGEMAALTSIGQLFAGLGETASAIRAYEQALAINRTVQDLRTEAAVLSSLGAATTGKAAGEYFGRALSLAHKSGDRLNEALIQNNLAYHQHLSGDTVGALHRAMEAHALARQSAFRILLPRVLHNIAKFQAALGDLQHARLLAHETLAEALAIDDPELEAKSMAQLADLPGGLAERHEQARGAIQIAESLRGRLFRRDLRTTYSAQLRDFYEVYVRVLIEQHARTPNAGFDKLAFETAERSRARGLIEMLRERDIEVLAVADEALLQKERKVLRELRTKAASLDRLAGPARETEEKRIQTDLAVLFDAYENLRAAIRRSSPKYDALVDPPLVNLAEIQRSLDPNTWLIAYWLDARRSHAWIVSADQLRLVTLAGRAEIEDTARGLHQSMSVRPGAPGSNEIATRRAKLSQLVIEPLGVIPRETRLVFVPDGALHFTPFAALHEPTRARAVSSIAPLTAAHEIAVLPATVALLFARQERTRHARAPLHAAVFADPVYDMGDSRVRRVAKVAPAAAKPTPLLRAIDDLAESRSRNPFGRLIFSREEADRIRTLAPVSTFQALDFAASRSTVTTMPLDRYRIVHFATHAVLNEVHPELSGIVLSLVNRQGQPQDGFLRLNDIYRMRVPVDLVVLSACQTALGREVNGEGLIGLTRGFMYAGASAIIGSLWKVDDQATSLLMRHFYEGLFRHGLHPAAALRRAQHALLQDRQWMAPYYWSAFFLQGEFSPAEWN